MTPEEKAHELVEKYYEVFPYYAEKCALIAVNECLKTCVYSMIYYWQEVQTEIEKL